MISARDAVRELHSGLCAPCMGQKEGGRPFCGRCYRTLPEHMRKALLQLVGHGYERAYDEAKRCITQRRLTARDLHAGHYTK